jgi:threonyl-tRNA synthetase
VKLTFPDGSVSTFEAGTTGMDVARSISRGLAKKALVCKLDGTPMDLTVPLPSGGEIRILTFADGEGADALRHSASHLLASAVKKLFPGTRLGIGPAIEDGFYYDMEIPGFGGEEDLRRIEKEMKRQVDGNLPFQRREMSIDEARELLREMDEPYKLELLEELEEQGETEVSFYSHGDFLDMCRGPHVPSTKYLRHMELLSVAGAYWRGDEDRRMLTRIYGTVFDSAGALRSHLEMLEEARKRDHRKLGRELDLFRVGGEGGPGLVYWLPAGTILKEELEGLWKDAHRAAGYRLVSTPHIAPADMWRTSGHYYYYRDNMYFLDIEGGEYAIKPMNCPGHILVYRNRMRSYRDLPLRLAELGTVYRYEKSGVLHGLMRVRGFTVDDGHIFCNDETAVEEIQRVVRFALYFLRVFDFGYEIELSLGDPERADHYAGEAEDWAKAEKVLAEALDDMGESYTTVGGEAAFYGPKIDIKLRDAIGRTWQGPTVQFDFNIPSRFDLTYVGADGEEHRVLLVHRALFGSVERFIGNLIEHYAGNFPGWLAPLQVVILPITSEQHETAEDIEAAVRGAGLRCELDGRNETIGYRIREAETRKVPFMLIVGEREAGTGRVALRVHGEGDRGSLPLDEVLEELRAACRRPELPH